MLHWSFVAYGTWVLAKPTIVILICMYPATVMAGVASMVPIIGYSATAAVSMGIMAIFML